MTQRRITAFTLVLLSLFPCAGLGHELSLGIGEGYRQFSINNEGSSATFLSPALSAEVRFSFQPSFGPDDGEQKPFGFDFFGQAYQTLGRNVSSTLTEYCDQRIYGLGLDIKIWSNFFGAQFQTRKISLQSGSDATNLAANFVGARLGRQFDFSKKSRFSLIFYFSASFGLMNDSKPVKTATDFAGSVMFVYKIWKSGNPQSRR